MKVKSFEIKNWRSISDSGVIVEPGDITVFTGANDSGKSATLLACYAALVSLTSEMNDWLRGVLYIEGSTHVGRTSSPTLKPTVEIHIQLNNLEAKYFAENVYQDDGFFEEIYGHDNEYLGQTWRLLEDDALVRIKGGNTKFIESFLLEYFVSNPIPFTVNLNNLKPLSHINEIINEKEYLRRKIEKLVSKINTEKLIAQLISALSKKVTDISYSKKIAEAIINRIENRGNYLHELISGLTTFYIPCNRDIDPERYATSELSEDDILNPYLGIDASTLIKFIQALLTEEGKVSGKYDRFLKYLQVIFPEVVEVQVTRPQGGRPVKDIFITWEKDNFKKSQPLSRSGTGIANAMYLVGRLLNYQDESCIAFIDEPETGIHPRLQTRFIKLLRKLTDDFSIQWLTSTHSPFITKNLKDKDKLYLVEHNGLETAIKHVDVQNIGTVFQSIGAYLPETLVSKGVILVEGATEMTVLPVLLEKIGIDIDKEGILIIPIGGDLIYHIDPSDLKKLHEKVMVIIDSDLDRSPTQGGNLTQKKINYVKECYESDVQIVLLSEYRTLENMYPKRAVATVLKTSEDVLSYDNYTGFPEVKDKVKFGELVAEEMTLSEVTDFPLVKAIRDWWL